MSDGTAHRIRLADRRDRNAILSSWLRSYWDDQGPQLVGVDRELYYFEHERCVKNALEDEDTITLVACNPEDEAHLFSWICGEFLGRELVVHYAFTFYAFRRFGLAKKLYAKLLEERGERNVVASHRTRTARPLLERQAITFNPYRIHT